MCGLRQISRGVHAAHSTSCQAPSHEAPQQLHARQLHARPLRCAACSPACPTGSPPSPLAATPQAGDHANMGVCRKTCGSCKLCAAGDMQCYNANRAAMGYLEFDPAEAE
jgi:hypothetical protein